MGPERNAAFNASAVGYPDSESFIMVYPVSPVDTHKTYQANLPDSMAWRTNNQVFTDMAAVDHKSWFMAVCVWL
jgi:hypothetical protein